MKRIILLLTVLISLNSLAQTFTPRTNGTFTPVDPFLSVPRALYIPRSCDTAVALNGGKDTVGALVWDTCNHRLWIRDRLNGTKYWRTANAQDLQATTNIGNKTTSTIISYGVRTPLILPDTTSEADYTFIVLPDLQGMSQLHPEQLRTITSWIRNNYQTENIKAVLDLGDVTELATNTEFMRADSLFDLIDSLGLPYLPTIGNHDYNGGGIFSTADRANISQWNTWFGTSRFAGKPWYGNAFHNNTANHYMKFDVGTKKYLVIGVEFMPTDSALAWAQSVIDSNLDKHAIITTHSYITAFGERSVDTSAYAWADIYNLSQDNNGAEMWTKFVRKNKTIDFVFNGHFIQSDTNGYLKRISEAGNHGNAIHQIMINYQSKGKVGGEINRGDGYFLKVRFSPSTGMVHLSAYSSYLNVYDPLVDSFYIDYPVTKVEGSLSIENGLYNRGEVRLDSTLWVQKLPRDRFLITRENGRIDTIPDQSANTFFSGPATGIAANPTFRLIVASDIPSGSGDYIQNQTATNQSASFRISGTGVMGTSVGSTAKLSINNGGGGNTLAIGPLLSNSIANTFHSIDTIVTANLGAQKIRLYHFQRDNRFSDDGLSITDWETGITGNVIRFKNSLTWVPTSTNHSTSSLSVINIRQFGGFTGVSTLTGPTNVAYSPSAQISEIDVVNAGGSSLIRATGFWSGFKSVASVSIRDTIENYVAFNSGAGSGMGIIKNFYHHYMHSNPGQVNWGIYQTGTNIKHHFEGGIELLNVIAPPSTYNLLVHGLSDSGTYQVPVSTFATGNTLYTGDGTLPTDRNIASGGNTLRLSGANNSDTLMSIVNTGTSSIGLFSLGSLFGIDAQSTTTGLRAFGSATGMTAEGGTSEGAVIKSDAIRGATIQSVPATTNTVQEVIRFERGSTGGPGANGIGGSATFYNKRTDNTSDLSNSITSKFTNAVAANLTSQLVIAGKNNGSDNTLVTIDGNANITFGTTNSIVGTTGTEDATIGNIGERLVSTISTYTNYATTATYQNIASITLSAGDWDISAFGTFSSNAATLTAGSDAIFLVATATASATGSTEGINVAYVPQASLLGTNHESISIPAFDVHPSTTTTYYFNTQATFTVGNPQFVGTIRAKRTR